MMYAEGCGTGKRYRRERSMPGIIQSYGEGSYRRDASPIIRLQHY